MHATGIMVEYNLAIKEKNVETYLSLERSHLPVRRDVRCSFLNSSSMLTRLKPVTSRSVVKPGLHNTIDGKWRVNYATGCRSLPRWKSIEISFFDIAEKSDVNATLNFGISQGIFWIFVRYLTDKNGDGINSIVQLGWLWVIRAKKYFNLTN